MLTCDMRWTSFVLFVCGICLDGAQACAFHCGRSVCGGPVRVVNYTFPAINLRPRYMAVNPASSYRSSGCAGVSSGMYTCAELPAVDIRGRNITQILPGAFQCWEFGDYHANGTIMTRGILMDNNPLGVLPNASVLNGANVSHISCSNCSITAMPNMSATSFAGLHNRFFDVSHDNV